MKLSKFVRNTVLALAATLLPLSPAMAQGSGGQTILKIYNASNNPVTVWLTLGAYPNFYPSNPGFVQNVTALNNLFKPPVNFTGGGLQGSFVLGAGKLTALTLPVGQAISGNFCFGTLPPTNCTTPTNPNGQNLAEFTLNTNTPAYVHPPQITQAQEAIDISCVNGVNAKIAMDLYQAAGSGNWATTGFGNVTHCENKQFGTKPNSPNRNQVGVFPQGCDNCTSSVNPGCPPQWEGWNPSTTHLCNVQRLSANSGGTVLVTFSGFYPNQSQTVKKP